MATPTEAATTLDAWRRDNFGWLTAEENRALLRLVRRITVDAVQDADRAMMLDTEERTET